jgi:hypothetical protein
MFVHLCPLTDADADARPSRNGLNQVREDPSIVSCAEQAVLPASSPSRWWFLGNPMLRRQAHACRIASSPRVGSRLFSNGT